MYEARADVVGENRQFFGKFDVEAVCKLGVCVDVGGACHCRAIYDYVGKNVKHGTLDGVFIGEVDVYGQDVFNRFEAVFAAHGYDAVPRVGSRLDEIVADKSRRARAENGHDENLRLFVECWVNLYFFGAKLSNIIIDINAQAANIGLAKNRKIGSVAHYIFKSRQLK